MSGFNKLFEAIVASSIWDEEDATRLVWITMLATKDARGVVSASVPGLARIANVRRPLVERALQKFLGEDADSRDLERAPERKGRRIETVDGGWKILNHEYYRDLQVSRDYSTTPDAVKKRQQRSGQTGTMSDDVPTPYASASASGSSQEVVTEKSELDREDRLDTVTVFAARFGRFAEMVDGFIRAQRSPDAVMATLDMHLLGELNHQKATVDQLGLAVQAYKANEGTAKFSTRYFAGFVRDVIKGIEVVDNRKRNTVESRQIDAEAADRTKRAEEDSTSSTLVATFMAQHPERYKELLAAAERAVPATITMGRSILVRAELLSLIKREIM